MDKLCEKQMTYQKCMPAQQLAAPARCRDGDFLHLQSKDFPLQLLACSVDELG